MFLKKFLLFGLIAAVLPAVAEEAADRKTATSLKYVEHELDTRQNKFTSESNKAMEYTDSAGDVQKRAVTSDLDNGGTDSLPMVGGVNTKLATKQDDIAAINDHTAVTYTGTAGTIGAKGIYQATESYADQSDNLIDAKTFNAALKRGLDSEFLCSEYKPGTDLCWVWSIHNNASTNLFDKTDGEYIRAYVHATTGVITEGTEQYSFVVPCQPNTTYSLSGMIGGNSHWGSFTDKSIGTVATVKRTGNGTITTGANDKYLIGLAYTSNGTYDYRNTLNIEKSTPYTTLVPAGYTPVEWIQSNGTQYIDTGRPYNSNYTYKVGYQYVSYPDGAKGALGARQTTVAGTGTFDIGCNATLFYFYNNSTTANKKEPRDLNHHIVEIDYTNSVLNLDGNTLPWQAGTGSAWQGTYNIYIGRENLAGTPNSGNGTVKWDMYKVYDGNNLVQNFIPARQNSDNKVGMYDTVSGEFFPSIPTNTNFIAGPDINNIIYVPQNQ